MVGERVCTLDSAGFGLKWRKARIPCDHDDGDNNCDDNDNYWDDDDDEVKDSLRTPQSQEDTDKTTIHTVQNRSRVQLQQKRNKCVISE